MSINIACATMYGQQRSGGPSVTRIIALLYGFIVYLLFLVTFLYTIGFVEGIPGIKTIDSGPTDRIWIAVVVNVLLLGLFAVQHSVMARQGFKRWWTRFVSPSVERSTFVLAASLSVALLLWQWRPLPAIVWSVDNTPGQATLYLVSALGWSILLASTFLINHFELFGLQQVFNYWRGVRFNPPAFKTLGTLQVRPSPALPGLYPGVLGRTAHDPGPPAVCSRDHGLHIRRNLLRRARSDRAFRRRIPSLPAACADDPAIPRPKSGAPGSERRSC